MKSNHNKQMMIINNTFVMISSHLDLIQFTNNFKPIQTKHVPFLSLNISISSLLSSPTREEENNQRPFQFPNTLYFQRKTFYSPEKRERELIVIERPFFDFD